MRLLRLIVVCYDGSWLGKSPADIQKNVNVLLILFLVNKFLAVKH
jgi:hypothetical protein